MMNVTSIFSSVLIVIVTALITYFFTTRNIKEIVSRVVLDNISIHEKIHHKDDPWDITDKKIKEHMVFCGEDMKDNIQNLASTVRVLSDTQIRHNTEIAENNKLLIRLVDKLGA